MYKIVNIIDLNVATEFIKTDKVIEFINDHSQMRVGENDYAHKNKTYLSSAIDIADDTLNSYTDAIDEVTSTYITSELSSVYIKEGSLIPISLYDNIMNSDAFLTKEGCKKLETECISYINELKNKAVSVIVAEMNESFIKQNSVGRIAYGQENKSGSSADITYTQRIAQNTESEKNDYDFETGEFSLYNLLFGLTSSKLTVTNTDGTIDRTIIIDFWHEKYSDPLSSFCPFNTIESFDDITSLITDDCYAFNSVNISEDPDATPDYKVRVPEKSYDFKRNTSIPMAQIIEFFLKKQIKRVIKQICDKYMSPMTSVPTLG